MRLRIIKSDRVYPTKMGFRRSIGTITKEEYDRDYEYALWSKGFECAIRKMRKLNKIDI